MKLLDTKIPRIQFVHLIQTGIQDPINENISGNIFYLVVRLRNRNIRNHLLFCLMSSLKGDGV